MENTYHNKLRFSSQYLYQDVYVNPFLGTENYCLMIDNLSDIDKNDYLLLKSISNITEEHARKVCEIFDVDAYNAKAADSSFDLDAAKEWIEGFYSEPAGYFVDGYTGNQLLCASDFLRSEGYALAWLDASVETQIAFGWVKVLPDTETRNKQN